MSFEMWGPFIFPCLLALLALIVIVPRRLHRRPSGKGLTVRRLLAVIFTLIGVVSTVIAVLRMLIAPGNP